MCGGRGGREGGVFLCFAVVAFCSFVVVVRLVLLCCCLLFVFGLFYYQMVHELFEKDFISAWSSFTDVSLLL